MTEPLPEQDAGRPKSFWITLGVILAFALGTRLFQLGHPQEFYFDEVYHGFTATQYLHGNLSSYDPFAKPPANVAYEWTHPPLSKLIMSAMMLVFGEDSFGWRVGGALFGTASIGLTALIALELFGSAPIALLSAGLLSLEGLFFVQSRIAMNDVYFIFFALGCTLFYLRWKKSRSQRLLYCCGLFLGLAAATKWTTLYLFLILAIDLGMTVLYPEKPANFSQKRQKSGKAIARPSRFPWPELLQSGIVLPALVYVGSYLQFFLLGGTWKGFQDIQYQMKAYHIGLSATHSYQSTPWQWLLNLRPVWMWARREGEQVANIYNLGNSIILISGFVAALWTLFRNGRLDPEKRFLLVSYFMLWLPWTLSPRIMLFYHYTPAIPFLCILLARGLVYARSQEGSRGRWLLPSVLTASVLWFVVFFPHMTGLFVPAAFADVVYFALPWWK